MINCPERAKHLFYVFTLIYNPTKNRQAYLCTACLYTFSYKFFVTSFKYSANSSFKSSLESAKSTVACKNPCLLPISYLLPSKSYAYISSFFASITSASVSCISPPAPLGVFSRQSNIAGVITYLPSTATSDGASYFFGFSTIPFSLYILPSTLSQSTIPYFET